MYTAITRHLSEIPTNRVNRSGLTATADWAIGSKRSLSSKRLREVRNQAENHVSAWQACVTQAKGLICWAKQTDNPKEVQLTLELRYLTVNHPSHIYVATDDIQYSNHLKPLRTLSKKELGVGAPTDYLFVQDGKEYEAASNFIVTSDAPDYRCSAAAPSLPIPSKPGDTVQTGDYPLDKGQCEDHDNKGNHPCQWTPTILRPVEPKSRFEVSVALDIDTAIDPDSKHPDSYFSGGCNRGLAVVKLPGGYILLKCASITSTRQSTTDPGVTDTQHFEVTESCQSEGSPVEVTIVALPVGCGWMTLKRGLVTWKEIKE